MIALFNMMQTLKSRLRDDEEGQAVVEYALLLVLISVVAIVAMDAVGTNVTTVFESARDALAGVVG